MGSPSLPMSSRSSFPPWYRVIRSSWTTCLLTRSPASNRQSRRAGATRLLLPPYSPDFNPIEQAFAKLKALLRKAAARTVDGLWDAIAEIIELFTPTECANFFANSGYEPE